LYDFVGFVQHDFAKKMIGGKKSFASVRQQLGAMNCVIRWMMTQQRCVSLQYNEIVVPSFRYPHG
jgi:hypothetical protein